MPTYESPFPSGSVFGGSVFGSGVGSVFPAAPAEPDEEEPEVLTFGPGQAGGSIAQGLLSRQAELMGAVGVPDELATPDAARQANEAAIAKLATVNPELAQQLTERLTGDGGEDKGFFDHLKDLAGDVFEPVAAIGGKLLDILSRPAQIIPELIVDEENDPWYEDIGEALSGNSEARGADVLDKWGVDSKFWQAVGGFAFDVLADPLTYVGGGWLNAGKNLATKSASTAVASKWLSGRLGKYVGSAIDEGTDVNGLADDLIRRIGQKGVSRDMAEGLTSFAMNSEMDRLVAASLELGEQFSAAARSRTLKKTDEFYLSSIDEAVPVKDAMRFLEDMRKQGGSRAKYMQARNAAAVIGGRRFRVYVPGTPLKYISPALPGTQKVSMAASRVSQLFTGQSGLSRLTDIVARGGRKTAEGGEVRLGGEAFAGWADVDALRSGGWSAVKESNPDLYHYLKGGGIRGGSMLIPLSQQLGNLAIHLTPGGWASRSGSLLSQMAGDTKRHARDHVVNFMGEHGFVLKNADGKVEKGLTEVRKTFSIYERMNQERAEGIFDFIDATPDDIFHLVKNGDVDAIPDEFRHLKQQWDGMAPEEKTAVDMQKRLFNQTLDAANREGARVQDVRSSLAREAVVLPQQGRQFVKNANVHTRDVLFYKTHGAEYTQMASQGMQPTQLRPTNGFGRAVKLEDTSGTTDEVLRPTVDVVPVVANLENPLVIDERVGEVTEAAILDDTRRRAASAVDRQPHTDALTPGELVRLKAQQTDDFITAELTTKGRDGIVHIDSEGKKTVYAFKTEDGLVRKAKVLSIDAEFIPETQGFAPRLTTDSWDRFVGGVFTDDPDLLRRVKGELHRKHIHKNVRDAEASIKAEVDAALGKMMGDLPDGTRQKQLMKMRERITKLPVFERNPLKVHEKYLRTIAERVADAKLGTFVTRIERLNDLGAFGTGGAVNAPVFHYVEDHQTLREARNLNVRSETAAGMAVGHHWAVLEQQEKLLAVKGEEFAKLRATLREDGKRRFPVAGSHDKIAKEERRLAVLEEKSKRAFDSYNKLVANYKTRSQDIKPALHVGKPPAAGWKPLLIKGFEDHYMPAHIADELNTAIRQRGLGDMNKWFRQVVMGPWKRWSTVYYPGFHIRNNLGAGFNNWLGGVTPGDYNDSVQVRWATDSGKRVGAEKVREWNVERLFRDLYDLEPDAITWHDLKRLTSDFGMTGTNSRGLSDIDDAISMMEHYATPKGNLRKATAKATESRGAEAAKGLAVHATETTENLHRTAAFLQGLKQFSGDPYAAREWAMMRHGDYLDLTDMEHRTIKTLVPFYKWLRTNLPFQLRSLIENPAKQLSTIKAGNAMLVAAGRDPDEEARKMPDWMQQTFNIPIPKGKDATHFVTLDLPMGDLFTGTNEYISMFLPTVRPFIENAVGESFFSGQPLEGKLVPLAAWADVPVVRELLSPFTHEGEDGRAMISDKAQNALSIIPAFSRFRNFLMADPERVKYRFHGFASTVFGTGYRPIDDEELTDQERTFYYQEILPTIDRMKDAGVVFPSIDEVADFTYTSLGFTSPGNEDGQSDSVTS